jgi:hypothetical protein
VLIDLDEKARVLRGVCDEMLRILLNHFVHITQNR